MKCVIILIDEQADRIREIARPDGLRPVRGEAVNHNDEYVPLDGTHAMKRDKISMIIIKHLRAPEHLQSAADVKAFDIFITNVKKGRND